MDSSVSSFQTRTRLSPSAARAGWGRPTVVTGPRARMRTRPMTVVSLRISRHPSRVDPPGRDAEAGIAGELEPWRGQGQGAQRYGGSGPAEASKKPMDRIGDRPRQGLIAGRELPMTRPPKANHLPKLRTTPPAATTLGPRRF